MLDRLFGARAPHYVREYRQLVRSLRQSGASEREALEKAVGGDYEAQGAVQAKQVLDLAPEGPFRLIDVGCGSGRAANGLKHIERLEYFGTDVVPDLLEHARKTVGRPDWRFEAVTSLDIPAENEWADIVMFMSVFTHLKPDEISTLLGEAARVLKPGGAAICSYLERNDPAHTGAFRPPWRQKLSRMLGRDVMISFTSKDELSAAMQNAGFKVERAVTDGGVGQHVLIGRKV